MYCRLCLNGYTYPLTPTISKYQNSRKIPNFILQNIVKQMVQCKSTAKEVSFEWSHHRISFTDSKVRSTLHVSMIDSTTERVNEEFFFQLGLFGVLIIALITDHCCQLIIKCKKAAVQKLLDTVPQSKDVESQDIVNMAGLRNTVEKRMLFGEIGRIALGKWGVLLVNAALIATQYGFCVGYFIFLGNTIQSMFPTARPHAHVISTTTPLPLHNGTNVNITNVTSPTNSSISYVQKTVPVHYIPPFAVLIVMPLIPLILFSYIRGVRKLGPVSFAANIALFVAFMSVVGYMLSGKCVPE